MSDPQAILLPSQLPPELAEFLGDYIFSIRGQNYLLSRSFDLDGYFVSLEIMKNDKSKNTWVVKIPTQLVLAVGQIEKGKEKVFGFVS
jgi:hypothetical protein